MFKHFFILVPVVSGTLKIRNVSCEGDGPPHLLCPLQPQGCDQEERATVGQAGKTAGQRC